MDMASKNELSHRGKAMVLLAREMERRMGGRK